MFSFPRDRNTNNRHRPLTVLPVCTTRNNNAPRQPAFKHATIIDPEPGGNSPLNCTGKTGGKKKIKNGLGVGITAKSNECFLLNVHYELFYSKTFRVTRFTNTRPDSRRKTPQLPAAQ